MADNNKPLPAEGEPTARPAGPATAEQALPKISDALRGLRYGSVLAIVQDGKVVQIERTEKTRFGK